MKHKVGLINVITGSGGWGETIIHLYQPSNIIFKFIAQVNGHLALFKVQQMKWVKDMPCYKK